MYHRFSKLIRRGDKLRESTLYARLNVSHVNLKTRLQSNFVLTLLIFNDKR